MGIDTAHPQYTKRKPDWTKMRDFYDGEDAVKARGETYLPSTKAMRLDGMGQGKPGREEYDAYKMRAIFPDYVKDAVEAYLGLLHQKPPNIELPEQMEPLRLKATSHGESLELLLRRINEEQLITGRGGLLADLPKNPDPANPLPYIEIYTAESIRNWDDGEFNEGEATLNLVILDESGLKRGLNFEWTEVSKYRVLMLGEVDANEKDGKAQYKVGVYESSGSGVPTFVESQMKPPSLRGSVMTKIPFTFFNTKDLVASPDLPPLKGLGKDCLAIYRSEADYRQNLFMQGQDTFVITGDIKQPEKCDKNELSAVEKGEPIRTGAGALIHLDTNGKAEYVGVKGEGLQEQRVAVENDRKRAETKSGQLIDATKGSGEVESGEALKVRVAAQTATLHQIARTAAGALESILKDIATWMNLDPNKVKVEPNLEFADYEMSGKDLKDLMEAKRLGAPISRKSIHGLISDKGLTKMPFEDEMEEIDQELVDDVKKGLFVPPGEEAQEDEKPGNKKPADKTSKKPEPKE